ncbi:MAG: ribosomal protein L7/L12 [Synergistaceae bacterium]
MKIRIENLPANQKISCIKAVRFAFDLGLKEAKDAVESAISLSRSKDYFSIEGETRKNLDYLRKYICMDGIDLETQYHRCGLFSAKITELNIPEASAIKTTGNQVFNVPNNEEGKQFMESLAKYLNRPKYSIKRRGRGTRKNKGSNSDIPLSHAEWVAVYLNESNPAIAPIAPQSIPAPRTDHNVLPNIDLVLANGNKVRVSGAKAIQII